MINSVTAHRSLGIGESVAKLFCHTVQYMNGLCHDLRTNTVTANHGNRFIHCAAPFAFNDAIRPPLVIMSLIKGGKGSA